MTRSLRGVRAAGPAVVACLAAATLLGFGGAWHWVIDLFAHFRVVYCLSLTALALSFFWRRRARIALVALVFAAVNAGTITPYLLRPAPAPLPPDAVRLRLFHANVLVLNQNKAAWAHERGRQLVAVGERIAQETGPRLVVGDLNATPWCHGFRLLLATSGLRDTERDGGLAFTWPEPLPVRIPIDHCLVSHDIQVRGRRAGRATGSDHLPLILDLAL